MVRAAPAAAGRADPTHPRTRLAAAALFLYDPAIMGAHAGGSKSGTGDREHGLTGEALRKEVCRRIRVARRYWDQHNNHACRRERERALQLYETLTSAEKEKIPQVLRVWLRYRSEKYFGDHRTAPLARGGKGKQEGR